MTCELCGDPSLQLILVLPLKRPNGNLNTMACLKCAEESSAYCKKHKRIHLGFLDGTTACPLCTEEMVKERISEKGRIFNTLKQGLPPKEFNDLLEWADFSRAVTGNLRATCVLRSLASKALRTQKSIDEVIKQIISEKSAKSILPEEF
jgi:NAD-dependent SIR2 family protein deacetylase